MNHIITIGNTNFEEYEDIEYCPVCNKNTKFKGIIRIIPDTYTDPGYTEGILECQECGYEMEIL
jgi:rubredoxin